MKILGNIKSALMKVAAKWSSKTATTGAAAPAAKEARRRQAVQPRYLRFRNSWGEKPFFGPSILPEQPKPQEFTGRTADYNMLNLPGVASRQERRAYLRAVAFGKISSMMPLASRRQRRKVATLMGNQYWRDLRRAENAPAMKAAA